MYDVRVSPIFIQILLYAMDVVVCIMWVLVLFFIQILLSSVVCSNLYFSFT
jgi:hypothetical protein